MICKNCGTQTAGVLFCTHCGAPLYEPEEKESVVHTGESVPEQAPLKSKKRRQKPRGRALRFGRLVLPALMLFYPLVYFFVDLFIQLPDAFFVSGESGNSVLTEFFSLLTESEFSFLSLAELKQLTFGEAIPLYRSFSIHDLLGVGKNFIPLWFVAVPSALCALMGALLILTKGRTLRSRFGADLTLFTGYFAAFSPAFGMLWIRISALGGGLALADAAATQTFLSVEAVLLVGIAVCFMLPALSVLRRAMANSHDMILYVPRGYRMLGGRSFAATRMFAIMIIGGVLAVTASMLILPILTTGRLTALSSVKQSLLTGLSSFSSSIAAILSARGSEVDFFAMTQSLLDAVYLLQIPFIALSAIGAISLLLTVVFDTKKMIFGHRRKYARLEGGTWNLCRIFLSPYFVYVATQSILVILWLTCSSLITRIDFSDVPGMLEILYLTAGYIRTICGTNTLYALIALGAVLLSIFAGNLCRKLVNLSK